MKIIVIICFLVMGLVAGEKQLTCNEKRTVLKALKNENISGLEKATLGLFDQSLFIGHTREEERLRKQKIRVLEMELKECPYI